MEEPTTSTDKHSILMRRFAAMAIDIWFLAFLILVINRLLPMEIHEQTPWLGGTAAICIALAYYFVMEALFGATLGKRALRIRVIRATGEFPGWWSAALRTALRPLEVNPFLLGGIPAYLAFRWSKHGQRLGDMLGKTFVVRSGDVAKFRSGEMSVESLSSTS